MMSKLHDVPCLRGLFVRATYAQPAEYLWEDAAGVRHTIRQAEGGEQGDPLMPLLFSLGIHDSLVEVHRLASISSRSLTIFMSSVPQVAPVRCTTCWMRSWRPELASDCTLARPECGTGRQCVTQMLDFGAEVWNPEGIKILGTPVGSRQFVHEKVMERVDEER